MNEEMRQKEKQAKKVIAVVSGKGGVGKSLVTSLLAVQASKQGMRTAILDADITGPSIPKTFHITKRADADENGVLIPEVTKGGIQIMSMNLLLDQDTQPVLWRSPIITRVVRQFWSEVAWKDVDIMFVDCPPGTGDVPLTVFQSLPVDGIIVVTSPQDLVTTVVKKAVNMAQRMQVPIIGFVENMSYYVCDECNKKHFIYGESKVETLAQEYGVEKYAQIPMDMKLRENVDAGTLEDYDCNWLEDFSWK